MILRRMTVFMCVIFLFNVLIFGTLLPLARFFDVGSNPNSTAAAVKLVLLKVQWLKYLGDDIFLMSMVYVLHHFGPYRQYLRAYARQSISNKAT